MTNRSTPQTPTTGIPWLEFFAQQGEPVQKAQLTKFPFSIGRNDSTDLPIHSTRVSREHAVIVRAGSTYRVRDLDSTNGTFVNGQRIEEATLSDGDMLVVGDVEFTFFSGNVQIERKTVTQVIGFRDSSSNSLQATDVIRCLRRLQETLLQGGVTVGYKPIVNLANNAAIGVEAIPQIRESKSIDQQVEKQLLALPGRLQTRLRQSQALAAAEHVAEFRFQKLFLPLESGELDRGFVEALMDRLSDVLPQPGAVVLDIPDASVNDIPFFHDLYACVRDSGAELCYSEFAAGKAQIEVHRKVPPRYVKLSPAMMRGLANDTQRQSQLKAVIKTIADLGSEAIAIDIENESLAKVFRRLGCPLGMGPYFRTSDGELSLESVATERFVSPTQPALADVVRGLTPALK